MQFVSNKAVSMSQLRISQSYIISLFFLPHVLYLKLYISFLKLFYNFFHKYARYGGMTMVEFFYFAWLSADTGYFYAAGGAFRE